MSDSQEVPVPTRESAQYDALLDMLIDQNLEICELTINTSVSATAVRKALKSRLSHMNDQLELLELPTQYHHVTVSGTRPELNIKLYKQYQDHRTKEFSFNIVRNDN